MKKALIAATALSVLAITACSSQDGASNAAEEQGAASAPEATQDAATSGQEYDLGEAAPVIDRHTGSEDGAVTVEEISPGTACEQDTTHQPESGSFLRVDVALEAGSNELAINNQDFTIINDNGEVVDTMNTTATTSCRSNDDRPGNAPAGATSSGHVLIDTDVESGTLIYNSSSSDARWQF